MSLNALATLLEVILNNFFPTHTQTRRRCFTPYIIYGAIKSR